jgi:predicted nucleotidyltransferase
LNSRNVEYLLIGGYAVNYYGYPRATADLDIWIAIDPLNAEKMAAALSEFGFANATSSLLQEPGKIIRMGVPPIRIEVLTSVSGVDFPNCFRNRLIADIDGVSANLISLADLKANKKAAGRLKDLADLEQLD